jgi:hypothetical protein
LCGVIEPWLLPSDDRELVKEELFLRLGEDSWDRIRGIFESSGRIVIEEREVDRYYYLCEEEFILCTSPPTALLRHNSTLEGQKGERGRKKKQFFDILYT